MKTTLGVLVEIIAMSTVYRLQAGVKPLRSAEKAAIYGNVVLAAVRVL